jgi:hypothetical protein
MQNTRRGRQTVHSRRTIILTYSRVENAAHDFASSAASNRSFTPVTPTLCSLAYLPGCLLLRPEANVNEKMKGVPHALLRRRAPEEPESHLCRR